MFDRGTHKYNDLIVQKIDKGASINMQNLGAMYIIIPMEQLHTKHQKLSYLQN